MCVGLGKAIDLMYLLVILQGMKYGNLIHVEVSANGGGKVVHCYQDELDSLSSSEMKDFVKVIDNFMSLGVTLLVFQPLKISLI